MDAVTFLIRLAPIEYRTFNLEPVHHKAGGDYSEAGVSRILQMMRQRGHGQFRRGGTMLEGHRTKRRFARGRAIELPGNFLVNGDCVVDRKFRKQIVRMLLADQWLTVIAFAGLEKFGKPRM